MSAFICNQSHVTALAVPAARNRILGWTDANQIGGLLHAENVKSVNYRYGGTTKPDFAMCAWAAFHEFSQVQIIKAARCLRDQSRALLTLEIDGRSSLTMAQSGYRRGADGRGTEPLLQVSL